ncbi:MAG: hypothetical protein NZ789_11255, partial [Pseudomonadales bacterium]|nr:hypothetical protein [Pseudomonadales bacterium]
DRGVDPMLWGTRAGDLYQIPNTVYQLRNGLATARGDIDFAVTVCSLPNGATSARIVTAR